MYKRNFIEEYAQYIFGSALLAVIMEHSGFRKIDDIETGLTKTPAPVDILEIHKIPLVHQPYFLQVIGANHKRGTHEPSRNELGIPISGL